MATFKDLDGDTWDVKVTCATIENIENHIGINLGLPDFGNPPLIVRLGVDSSLIIRLLWHCCAESAREYKVNRDEFFDMLEGKTFDDAAAAFRRAYVDFFLRRSIGGTGQRIKTAMEAIEAELNSGNKSTKPPATSDLTPAP